MAILTLFFIGTLEFVLINCCLPNCVTLINPVKLSSTFVSYSRGPDANNEICSFPFPLVTLRVTCKSGRRLSSFLSFKERIPKLVRLRIYVLSIAEFYSNLYLYNNLDMLNERWTFVRLYPQKNDFWSSGGCAFDPRLGLRNGFSEDRAWRTFISHSKYLQAPTIQNIYLNLDMYLFIAKAPVDVGVFGSLRRPPWHKWSIFIFRAFARDFTGWKRNLVINISAQQKTRSRAMKNNKV